MFLLAEYNKSKLKRYSIPNEKRHLLKVIFLGNLNIFGSHEDSQLISYGKKD